MAVNNPLELLTKAFEAYLAGSPNAETLGKATGPLAFGKITESLKKVPAGQKSAILRLLQQFGDPEVQIETLADSLVDAPELLTAVSSLGSKELGVLGTLSGEIPGYMAQGNEVSTSQMGEGDVEIDLDDMSGGGKSSKKGAKSKDVKPPREPKVRTIKNMPSVFVAIAEKLGLKSAGDVSANPEKRASQFLAELANKIDQLPDGKAKKALSAKAYEAMVMLDSPESQGFTKELQLHVQGLGRDTDEAFQKVAKATEKNKPKTFTKPPLKGEARMQTILKKLQARKSRGDPNAVSQLGKLGAVPGLPKAAQVFGEKLPGVSGVADEAIKSLPLGQQILAKGKKFLGNKSLLSGKNIGLGAAGLVGGSIISRLLESKFPSQEVELANYALDEGLAGPRSTEEILAEMRANQDIQTRMMNVSQGVNPKILQFLQESSRPPMTSTQQYIGPNPLLQGLESGQISLEQLLGRG